MACLFEFTKEKTKGTLKVTIPLVDIEERYKKILKENLPKIKLKGFRPGHVPINMIEKQFGQQFKFDALNDILSNEYKAYIDKENITPISQANIEFEENNIDFTKDINVILKFDLPPYVKIGDLNQIETEKIQVEVEEKDVELEIKRFQEKNSKLEEVDEPIQNDYFVDITAKAYDENGEFLRTIDRTLKVGENLSKLNIDQNILGLKKGDTKQFEVEYNDDVVFSDFKNKKIKYEVTINSVKISKLPELTDQFIKEKTGFETFGEYKKDLEKKLKEYADVFARKYNLTLIYENIKAISEIEIADSLVENSVENAVDRYAENNFGLRRQQLEQILKASNSSIDEFKNRIRPSLIKDMKTELIIDNLIKEKDIKVTEEMWNKLKEELSKEIEDKSKIEEEIKNRKANYEYYLKVQLIEDFLLENIKAKELKKYYFKDIPDLQLKLDQLYNPQEKPEEK